MGILGFVTGENARLDSIYSWFVAIIACVFVSFLAGYSMAPGVLFVLIQDRYDVTKQKASYPVNTLVASGFVFALFAGPILHRFQARKTLILASGLGVVGSCLSVYCPTNDPTTWLAICMAIRGAGSSLALTACWHVVVLHFEKHLSKALMLVVMGYPIGGLVLPVIIRSSAEAYGLEGSWLIQGAVYCQSILMAFLIKPYRDEIIEVESIQLETFHERGNRNNTEYSKDENKKVESFRSLLAALFVERNFYLLCFSSVIHNTCMIGVRTTVIDYGKDINLEPQLNAYMMEILACSDAAIFVTAIIIDRRLCFEETISCVVSIVAASTLVLMTLTKGYVFVIIAFGYSVCYSVCDASRGTMFASLGSDKMATAYGIALACSGLFQFTLPFLIGLFRGIYGSYNYLYYLFSLSNLIMALAFGFSRVKHWFKHEQV